MTTCVHPRDRRDPGFTLPELLDRDRHHDDHRLRAGDDDRHQHAHRTVGDEPRRHRDRRAGHHDLVAARRRLGRTRTVRRRSGHARPVAPGTDPGIEHDAPRSGRRPSRRSRPRTSPTTASSSTATSVRSFASRATASSRSAHRRRCRCRPSSAPRCPSVTPDDFDGDGKRRHGHDRGRHARR